MSIVLPIIIIVFVVAMLIGPIMLLQPSPRQRQLASIRQRMAARGVIVDARGDSRSGTAPLYLKPHNKKLENIEDWELARTTYQHDLHFYLNWDWAGKRSEFAEIDLQALHTFLDEVPESVTALGENSIGVYFRWMETSEAGKDIEAADAIVDQLDRLWCLLHPN